MAIVGESLRRLLEGLRRDHQILGLVLRLSQRGRRVGQDARGARDGIRGERVVDRPRVPRSHHDSVRPVAGHGHRPLEDHRLCRHGDVEDRDVRAREARDEHRGISGRLGLDLVAVRAVAAGVAHVERVDVEEAVGSAGVREPVDGQGVLSVHQQAAVELECRLQILGAVPERFSDQGAVQAEAGVVVRVRLRIGAALQPDREQAAAETGGAVGSECERLRAEPGVDVVPHPEVAVGILVDVGRGEHVLLHVQRLQEHLFSGGGRRLHVGPYSHASGATPLGQPVHVGLFHVRLGCATVEQDPLLVGREGERHRRAAVGEGVGLRPLDRRAHATLSLEVFQAHVVETVLRHADLGRRGAASAGPCALERPGVGHAGPRAACGGGASSNRPGRAGSRRQRQCRRSRRRPRRRPRPAVSVRVSTSYGP